MKALTLDDFGQSASLSDQPTPEVGGNDVLVKVHAASINAIDGFVAGGYFKGMADYRFPITIGRDFSGVVEAVGPDVTRFAAGDEVLGAITAMTFHDGTFGEYAKVDAEGLVAHKPAELDFLAAAALPLAGVTASVAVDALALREGERVLVVGATGGVGGFAIQLARRAGAAVSATALPADEEHVRELAADETFDYSGDIVAAARAAHPDGVDAIIDLVNRGDDFAAVAKLLGVGGRAVSTLNAADPEDPPGPDARVANVGAAGADPAVLGALAELAAAGELRVPIQRVYSLEQTPDALGVLGNGHVRGKLAISIGDGG